MLWTAFINRDWDDVQNLGGGTLFYESSLMEEFLAMIVSLMADVEAGERISLSTTALLAETTLEWFNMCIDTVVPLQVGFIFSDPVQGCVWPSYAEQ